MPNYQVGFKCLVLDFSFECKGLVGVQLNLPPPPPPPHQYRMSIVLPNSLKLNHAIYGPFYSLFYKGLLFHAANNAFSIICMMIIFQALFVYLKNPKEN